MDLTLEMKEYAKKNFVPIIRDANLEYLKNLIIENNVLNILEIGTAIGYSAISFALIDKNIKITTIEKDKEMIKIAKENIKKLKLQKQIKLIKGDALEVLVDDKFDLIFIDAAKSKYINFFEKYAPLLNKNGIIVSDNVDLLDLQRLTNSKKSKKLVEKMKEYKSYLVSLKDYKTEFISVGDGFAITKKIT